MSDQEKGYDPEFEAMHAVFAALEPLDAASRERVLMYIARRLQVAMDHQHSPRTGISGGGQLDRAPASASEQQFSSLAELHEAARPVLSKDRVLVAAYWLQVYEGADSFVSFQVNKALKDLGHGVAHITREIDALRQQTPALVLQLKKSGTTRQARKTYKVTAAGISAIKAMIDG